MQEFIQISLTYIDCLKYLIKMYEDIQYPKASKESSSANTHTFKRTLASPNTMYVSDAGFLYTSGLLITNSIFFDLRIVTLLTPCTYKIETKNSVRLWDHSNLSLKDYASVSHKLYTHTFSKKYTLLWGKITQAEYPSMKHISSKSILYVGPYLNGADIWTSKFTIRGSYKHAN
jgi:hypothetical protein